MPFEVQAVGSYKDISKWLCDNVGKPIESIEFDSKYTNKRNWQILPYGISTNTNTWIIRLWDPNKVLLTKLRWE
jgi:hypothetical protein